MNCPACHSPMRLWLGMPIDAKKDESSPFGTIAHREGYGQRMALPMPQPEHVSAFRALSADGPHRESHLRPAPDAP
ncbi:hypothetical protein [Altericroceibacterium xinjiangense]|uniref:hypothetical protein n=1 Tax=Altericroceibacterium xinjiangense TaxID=762261 RepID=UPI000F7E38ED|nr:hypothetical protein [Altericroceibacterium xinjiangense]